MLNLFTDFNGAREGLGAPYGQREKRVFKGNAKIPSPSFPLRISPLKKERANKIFIKSGNSLCRDEFISDIKSSGGGGERWKARKESDVYRFIDEAVVEGSGEAREEKWNMQEINVRKEDTGERQ